ncbi:MAG: OmpA family protein [Epsilonproteobacteria bacterium]|nr:OmpA family protein [Campylobacterota bacterium]OIO17329.1 MAG: cell envelope biogenesis protein OmpA [Helicobacteraceae bacterium CG1_02_36_14]PIP10467.1 MAG: cell envelope biogenesis protein OmpA [Sulfurimonas sp. CG23_combo_of_CG06-09_8_20_14_all_36_33]PIS26096.1 MAG: OmpA family protein [Sulfurimonas sp. CG08_land_8_20_14_0_20_36_33]PIU35983.1 MAG: OmpA family protein [Sulfurimonas sp. CG07_land_8_20_14_0_80_36_56]PIV02785.1 MAG: OmpA family protein [Sulfurimonas sp. CG03_land_8_20_14_0
MQYILTLFLSSLLATSLFAAEDKFSDSSQATQSEFAYIQPIAVEEAPISKVKKVILDDDKDGVPNEKDRCPTTPKGDKVDITGCTILNDADKDGVPDKDDKCPETLLGTKVDYRGCELDSDDDGVVDSKDQCPNTSKDFVADGYGCPQTATLKVNFATNKYDVDDRLINQLQTFALFLKENPGYQVILYGYTDSIGDDAANKLLSQNRANAVKEALTRYGISKMKLTAIGRGKENPVASNKTKEGRAKNRRIEVELIK